MLHSGGSLRPCLQDYGVFGRRFLKDLVVSWKAKVTVQSARRLLGSKETRLCMPLVTLFEGNYAAAKNGWCHKNSEIATNDVLMHLARGIQCTGFIPNSNLRRICHAWVSAGLMYNLYPFLTSCTAADTYEKIP